jgi:hypothetical protein
VHSSDEEDFFGAAPALNPIEALRPPPGSHEKPKSVRRAKPSSSQRKAARRAKAARKAAASAAAAAAATSPSSSGVISPRERLVFNTDDVDELGPVDLSTVPSLGMPFPATGTHFFSSSK